MKTQPPGSLVQVQRAPGSVRLGPGEVHGDPRLRGAARGAAEGAGRLAQSRVQLPSWGFHDVTVFSSIFMKIDEKSINFG